MTVVANLKKDDICGSIATKNEGYFGCYGPMDLVADQREYDLPDDILNNIKKVEVSFDGTTWVVAKRRDINDIPNFVLSETWITGKYSNITPEYFVFRNSIFILSGTIISVSDGIRLWYIQFPDDIPNMTCTTDLSVATDITATIAVGFPKQFHELLCRGIIIDYKEANNIPLAGREPLYDVDLAKKIEALSPLSLDEQFEPNVIDDDGSDY